MKKLLRMGMKWICFGLCSLMLWGNTPYESVKASDLAYDENSSRETESYMDNDDWDENGFSESNSYEESEGFQSIPDNGSEIGLKDLQGWGKNTKADSGKMISDPYGVYYTTPQCEDMDDYWGERHHDSIQFIISKALNSQGNSAIIDIKAAINDSLDGSVQVDFNQEENRWEGKENTFLEYDSYLDKFIFMNDKIKVCLEKITSESAALYDRSHQQYGYQEPMLEGAFVSETGMNNGLTLYIYNIFNTKYYYVVLSTKDKTTTVIGEKRTIGEYIYNNCSIDIGDTEYYIDGVDLDENRIASAVRLYIPYWSDESEYYLYRSNNNFDAALKQNVYSGTYTISELNAVVNLQYNEASEAFNYNISVDGQKLETSSATAVCTGSLGYQVMSTDFVIDYTDYILDGSDMTITIPGISPEAYACTFEATKQIDYYEAYQYVLEDTYENYGDACQYALFDIDHDGIKELILSEGTSNADWTNDVYCVNDNGFALLIGSFARPVVLYEATDGNGIFAVWGNQGLEEVTRITKSGSEIGEEVILSDSIGYDENYVTYPNEIPVAYVNDYSLLEE